MLLTHGDEHVLSQNTHELTIIVQLGEDALLSETTQKNPTCSNWDSNPGSTAVDQTMGTGLLKRHTFSGSHFYPLLAIRCCRVDHYTTRAIHSLTYFLISAVDAQRGTPLRPFLVDFQICKKPRDSRLELALPWSSPPKAKQEKRRCSLLELGFEPRFLSCRSQDYRASHWRHTDLQRV